MNNHTKPTSRRKFLLNASLGGAGVATAIVAGRKIASDGKAEAPAGQSRGYHVSEHILKYYKTTQV